jgi:hypothetical protein
MKNVKMLVAVAMMGTARLTGEWDAKEYVDSDGTTIQDTDSDYVTFDKDGTYTYTSGSTSQSGTWEFSSDKEKIKVGYTVGSTTFSSEVTIVRLTNKELWTKDDDGDMVKYEKK